jgi:ethanolaminephosphotransferase
MQSKLIEMDDIIKYVHESIQKQDLKRIQENPQALPSLLLLCSDHGMSESGNHGGPTLEESSALMMFFGLQNKKQFKKTNQQKNRRQVDLVPTLSGLFDLKIPTYNTGLVLPQEIFSSQIKYLKALLKNFQQLYQLCKIRPAHHRFAESFYHKHRSLFDYMDHQKEHKETDNTLIQKIHDASLELQERVSLSDDSDFDILKISSGIGVIIMVILLFFLFGRTSFMFFYDPEEVNGGFCFDLEGFLLVLWSLLQIISLTSSSRIENEHVTYFFSLTTLLLSYGIKQFFLCRNTTNEPKSEIVTFIGLTILLRLLRSRNQIINFGRLNGIVLPEGKPGQEFAKDESVSILSTASLEFFPSNLNFVQFSIIQSLYVSFLLIWMILSLKIFFYTKKKSFILMFVWTLMTVGLSCSLQCSLLAEEEISFSSTSTATATSTASASATEINRYAQAGYLMSVGLVALAFVCEKSHHRLLIIECSFWIIVTILQRNGNLPSLAVLAFFLGTLNTSHIFKTWAAWKIALFNIWLSQCAFFALGNSHLVTTIDISQVYHGLNEFSQVYTSFFVLDITTRVCYLTVNQCLFDRELWDFLLLSMFFQGLFYVH